ncbi:MAG: TVP38/TMEM64 family protein [Proteobacteria bacterium]|nr:TVP38/TMEM64 family protein [Pseudomonadota bacterium]
MQISERIRRFIPLAVVLLVVALAYATGLTRYLSFAPIREHGQWLREQVREHYLLSLLIYFLGYAALTTTAIPGAVFVTLTGGFLFGTWVGGFTTSTAATLGAVNVYYIVRSSLGQWLREWAERDQGRMKQLRDGLAKNAFWYLFTLRVVPAVPFILINIASGLTSIPVRPYALATWLGILPAFIIYSAIGSKLGVMFDQGREPNLRSLLEPQFVVLLVGVGFLSFVLPLVFRIIKTRREKAASAG